MDEREGHGGTKTIIDIGSKSIRTHVRAFWNCWFHKLSLNMSELFPIDLKPEFSRFISKCSKKAPVWA